MGLFKKKKQIHLEDAGVKLIEEKLKALSAEEQNKRCAKVWARPSLKRLRRQAIFCTRAVRIEHKIVKESGKACGMSVSIIARALAGEVYNDDDSIEDLLNTFESRFKQVIKDEK